MLQSEQRGLSSELRKHMQRGVIVMTDLPNELQIEILDAVMTAIDKFQPNFESASQNVKEFLDKQYGFSWHVVIGKGFSYDVSAMDKRMLKCFCQGDVAALIFKC